MKDIVLTDAVRKICTDRQWEVLNAYHDSGSLSKAAKRLGMGRSGVRKHLDLIKIKLNSLEPSIDNAIKLMADNADIKGISDMQKNEHGKPMWVKYNKQQAQAVRNVQSLIDASLSESVTLKTPAKYAETNYNTDVIPWFNIGDGHLGMISYEHEVGANFDLKIASADLCAAIKTLIDNEPTCERCVIQDMGDFTHYDNNDGITAASGHALDYDTRYSKMIQVYYDTMEFIIDYALTKFKYVDVIINQGNHSRVNDLAAAIVFRKFYARMYSKESRVHVLDNQSVFIPYRMGNTFVMTHHSDKCKPKNLAHVMATDFAEDWGESKYRYIDIGHIHHQMSVKEHPGCTVESFNQLATMDKYAHDGGWRSRSCLTVVRRSKTYGEIGRQTIPLEMVRDIIDNLPPGETAKRSRRKVYSV